MNEPKPIESETRGGSCAPASCSVRRTKLLRITDRAYGRTHLTSQEDIDRAVKLGLKQIRLRCRNGTLLSRYHEAMGWHGKASTLHVSYLDGARLDELDVTPNAELSDSRPL